MLKIQGEKKPLSSKNRVKTPDKPLTKSEIFSSLNLPHPNPTLIKELAAETSASHELLAKIEFETNKIHKDLRKLKKSRDFEEKSSKTPLKIEENREENSLKYHDNSSEEIPLKNPESSEEKRSSLQAYDSDPEYNRYLKSPLHKSEFPSQKAHSFLEIPSKSEENLPETLNYRDIASFELRKTEKPLKTKKNQEKHEENHLNFTVPKPFDFESREQNKALSITKRRFLEDLSLKKASESTNSLKFHAISVPEHIKDRSLFTKLCKIEENRRFEMKKNSRILTLQREKPFDFYLRDLKKPKKTAIERKEFHMKASPIPWYCSIPLLKRMQEEEEALRRERVAKHAQDLLSISHLPFRMEKHENEKKAILLKNLQESKGKNQENINKNFTFQPVKRKEIPDFRTLHEGFQALLDRKRSNIRPVVIKPFSFEASKKPEKREYLNEENAIKKCEVAKKCDAIELWRRNSMKKPKIQPPSTKKWEQAYEEKKNQRENEEKKKNLELENEKNKMKKRREIEERVKGSPAIVDNRKTLEERQRKAVEDRKKEMKKTGEDYKRVLDEIGEKVKKRLLLVENYEEGSKKMLKKKRLEGMNN